MKKSSPLILDPSCGKGEFLIESANKLASSGCSHVLSQLWAADFTQLNLLMTKKRLENWAKINGKQVVLDFTNIIKYSSFEELVEKVGTMKFDIIVGNPPYQQNDSSGDRKQLSHNLYSKFVNFAVEQVNKNGIVAMTIPNSWMTPFKDSSKKEKTDFKKIFRKYNLIKLNIGECERHFSVGSAFTYFVLENNKSKKMTDVSCKYKSRVYQSKLIIPDECPWIPLLLTDISIGIVSRLMWDKRKKHFDVKNDNFFHPVVNKQYKRTLTLEKSATHLYPQYHTNAKTKWSEIPHQNQFTKKVMFSKSGYILPIYDSGTMGTTDAGFWIEVKNKDEADNLISILNSRLYKFLFNINKWSGFNMPDVLYSLPYVDISKSWTNSQIYKNFNLTKEEIEHINNNTK